MTVGRFQTFCWEDNVRRKYILTINETCWTQEIVDDFPTESIQISDAVGYRLVWYAIIPNAKLVFGIPRNIFVYFLGILSRWFPPFRTYFPQIDDELVATKALKKATTFISKQLLSCSNCSQNQCFINLKSIKRLAYFGRRKIVLIFGCISFNISYRFSIGFPFCWQ